MSQYHTGNLTGLIDNPLTMPAKQPIGEKITNVQIVTSFATVPQYVVPTTGQTVSVVNSSIILNPAGTLSTLTLQLPVAVDGQKLYIISSQTVSALTFTNATFATSAVTALAVGTPVNFIYSASSGSWWRA
jgi:hypothetical protein